MIPLLSTLEDIRDIIIIIYGVLGILFLLIATVVVAMVGFTVKNLINNVRGMLDDTVKPAVNSIKDTAETVRGTTEFVGQSAVSPIVKAYGTVAGVRKGMSVFAGLKRK